MDNIATELKQEVLSQADIIADLEAQTIAQARTIREQALVIREHQAADVLAVEAIRSLTAELAQCKHALDDEVEEVCTCGHSLDSHAKNGVHPCKECVCAMFWRDDEGDMCECGHPISEHTYDGDNEEKGCMHRMDDGLYCPCMNYEATK